MSVAIAVLWQVVAPIFLVAGSGYLLARKGGLSPRDLSRAAFYLLSPCLLFDKLGHTTLPATALRQLALFALLTMAGSGLVAWLICRLLGYNRPQTSAFVLVAAAGNTGNYGLPANQFAFGPVALESAIVYFAVSTLLVSTLGVYLAASGRKSAKDALGNVLRVPLVYAGLAAVLVQATGWQAPLPVERAIALVGEGAIPVMLVLLGVQLANTPQGVHNNWRRVSLAAATKLVGGALLGILLAQPLGLAGLARQSVILESAMPTAVMTTVLATEYDAEPHFTAGAVLISTLGSLVTVTLVLTYLG